MGRKNFWEQLFKTDKLKWNVPDASVVKLVPILRKKRFKRILDLGCGSGRHALHLAKRNFFVIGLDISPTTLLQTQKWLEGIGKKLEKIHIP